MAHHGQKAKAVLPYRRVIVIHDNTVEETVDRSSQPAKRLHGGKERLAILCPGSRFRQGCERAKQRSLGIFGEQARVCSVNRFWGCNLCETCSVNRFSRECQG